MRLYGLYGFARLVENLKALWISPGESRGAVSALWGWVGTWLRVEGALSWYQKDGLWIEPFPIQAQAEGGKRESAFTLEAREPDRLLTF